MPRLRPESSSETSSIVSGPLPVQSNGGVGCFSSHGALFHCTQPQALRLSDELVVEQIDVIQDELSVYGYRRVTRALQAQGYDIHHKRVARIIDRKSVGIQPKRRFVRTTDSQHDGPICPNLYRNRMPDQPDRIWWRISQYPY